MQLYVFLEINIPTQQSALLAQLLPGNPVAWQLFVPQTRLPAQSLSVSQSPSLTLHAFEKPQQFQSVLGIPSQFGATVGAGVVVGAVDGAKIFMNNWEILHSRLSKLNVKLLKESYHLKMSHTNAAICTTMPIASCYSSSPAIVCSTNKTCSALSIVIAISFIDIAWVVGSTTTPISHRDSIAVRCNSWCRGRCGCSCGGCS